MSLCSRRSACVLLLGMAERIRSQAMENSTDSEIVKRAHLIASSGRVDLYADDMQVDPALAAAAHAAIEAMERLLDQPWDTPTFGPRVRMYVSARIRVSHVWGGYGHRSDPRALIFLPPHAAQRAVGGHDATYAHELAHLLTWRFTSHSLREGLADYLALQLHPGAAVGPNRAVHLVDPEHVASLAKLVGTRFDPPAAVQHDPAFRRSYYAASYFFVAYLIRRSNLSKFLQLYASDEPEAAYVPMYGAGRQELFLKALGA
jgi:hypothetical protein